MMTRRLMEGLRSGTRAPHEQLMALPYFVALEAKSVELVSYVGHLRSMAIIHGAIEYEVPRAENATVASVWREELAASELLDRDLAFFAPRLVPDVPSAIDEALGLAANIRRRRVADPVSLLGYLYVLEGSRLGAPTVTASVARALDLRAPDGLAYLSGRGAAAETWKAFVSRMNAAVADEATQARVIEAARELFDGLAGVFRGLYPVTETRFTAAHLNPEAGAHPVPEDPREIWAAVRAGEACWSEFPYFERRFGARGKRFTRSDSAWLATLVSLDADTIARQLRWLGGVLAARGMPRLLLQRHLEILASALSDEVPSRSASYEKLVAAARAIEAARHAAIPSDQADLLAAQFEASAEPQATDRIAGMGELLVAAVQDERAGVEGAVESLERWVADASRFSPAWIAAVQATIAAARASA